MGGNHREVRDYTKIKAWSSPVVASAGLRYVELKTRSSKAEV